jgi:hypothetical protein
MAFQPKFVSINGRPRAQRGKDVDDQRVNDMRILAEEQYHER